jgi:hypothetical protein
MEEGRRAGKPRSAGARGRGATTCAGPAMAALVGPQWIDSEIGCNDVCRGPWPIHRADLCHVDFEILGLPESGRNWGFYPSVAKGPEGSASGGIETARALLGREKARFQSATP